MNFSTMHSQRKLIFISAAVGVISIFLPWFSAGAFGFSVHINGFHGWGILAFLCFVAAIAAALIGAQTQQLEKNTWLIAIVCGVLALLSVIITLASSHSGDFGLVSANIGFGVWLALAAAIGITVFAWLFKKPEQNFKSSFDSLKKTVSVPSSFKPEPASTQTNRIEELERLSKLKESGSITEEEFQQLKSKLL